MPGIPDEKFELRFLDELFIFTKCEKPEEVVEDLQAKLTTKLVDVFHNGEKVYVVPVNLSKGMAVRRLRKRLQPAYIIAAGDSEFDCYGGRKRPGIKFRPDLKRFTVMVATDSKRQ